MLYARHDEGRGAMTTIALNLWAATSHARFEGVQSFVGEDESGSFGILPGHHRFMTSLTFGLARFRCDESNWQFLALPGGLLYFVDDELTINTRRYLLDTDYERISSALSEHLLAEEEKLRSLKESLHRMEEEMLRRLWEMRRGGEKGL